jgi:hypothetical protein
MSPNGPSGPYNRALGSCREYQSVGVNSRSSRQLNTAHKYKLYGEYCELLSVIASGKHSYQCAIKSISWTAIKQQ